MGSDQLTVAVIGCGRLGQHYATAYNTFPDTELVAIAEYHPERRKIVGERFGVSALFQNAEELFASVVPDVAAVVLPGKFIKAAVIAAAEAGVKGVSTDKPQEKLEGNSDAGMSVSAHFQMSNGLSVPVFGEPTPNRGVDVWNEDALIRWDWDPPEIYQGFDETGRRVKIERPYTPYQWSEFYYLGYSIRSFLAAIRDGSQMAVSGRDLRQALEVAIAAKYSALWGSRPLTLPLEDRSLTLYPSQARWEGHDPAGTGQTLDDASKPWPGYKPIS